MKILTTPRIEAVSRNIQKLRWQTRLATGFNPAGVSIPKRFTEVTTWKGKVDGEFLERLKNAYAKRLLELGAEASAEVPGGRRTP
jgi:aldehyde:ferredoxin oxidoreductase